MQYRLVTIIRKKNPGVEAFNHDIFLWHFWGLYSKVKLTRADMIRRKVRIADRGGRRVVSYNQALSAYRETRVRTASPGSLVVMLYDEAIKRISLAMAVYDEDLAKNPSKIETFNAHIMKSQEIITELMASLNMDSGGEIAKNLLSLYTWFNQQLLEGNIEKNKEKLASVRDLMDQLRSAWIEVANTASAPSSMQSSPAGINIAG